MEMSYKAWLCVALKVLGVMILVNGGVQAVYQWGSLPSAQGMLPAWMTAISIAVPLVVLGAGLYLVLGTQHLIDRVWSDQQEELDSARAIFMVAIKVMGVVLVVQALPEVVEIISNALYIYSVSGVWNTSAQSEFIYERLIATLLKLGIGCYLLLKGDWLQRVAFPPASNDES